MLARRRGVDSVDFADESEEEKGRVELVDMMVCLWGRLDTFFSQERECASAYGYVLGDQ